MVTPALYECVIRHARSAPVRHAFAYQSYLWLIDLDSPPARGPLARFDATREELDGYLAASGVDLGGGRVLMLAHARVLGHVFNPLTVYWCHDPDGALVCVVAEVHNTYGGSHRYLVRTDERGSARADKEFYVSPFHAVEGWYRLSLPEPDERLALTITLHLPEGPPFTASVRGVRRPATWPSLLRMAVRHPWAPLAGAIRIRIQGIRLFLRGVPVVPREESTHDRLDR
ncbi:DUF1365 domain-containing protein [Actinocorallia longicatena]|uniref:DUF1365 domain-containing protein n=1 Tax=Actinocorallia longicatena TaxID=111803 RepID=A0ABP6QFU8_9ACTN